MRGSVLAGQLKKWKTALIVIGIIVVAGIAIPVARHFFRKRQPPAFPVVFTTEDNVDFDPGALVPALFAGYDSVTGNVLPNASCVEPVGDQETSKLYTRASLGPAISTQASGQAGRPVPQKVIYELSQITNSSSLRSEIGQSVSGAVSYAEIASLGASNSSTEFKQFSQFHETVSARVFVEQQSQYSTKVRLTGDAQKWADSDARRFRAGCGDRFVAALVKGGELHGLVSFNTTSATQRNTVEQSISAHAKGAGATKEDFSSLETDTASVSKTVILLRKGPSGDVDPSLEGIIKASGTFSTDVGKDPYTVRVITMPYPRSTSGKGLPTTLLTFFSETARNAIELRRRQNGLEYMHDHGDEFPMVSPDSIVAEIASTKGAISKIRMAFDACLNDPSPEFRNCTGMQELSIPSLPERSEWQDVNATAVNSNGGGQFLFSTAPGEHARFQMKGQWSLLSAAANAWVTVGSNSDSVKFVDDSGGVVKTVHPSAGAKFSVDPSIAVTWYISDPEPSNNSINSQDKVQWRKFADAGIQAIQRLKCELPNSSQGGRDVR